MRNSRGANLRAVPVEPGTQQSDAPPELSNQTDAAALNSGLDDLQNLPESPKATPIRPGQQQPSDIVQHDESDLDSLPDSGGQLGHVYDAVYHGDPDNVAKVLDTSKKLGADPMQVAGSLKDASKAANGPDGNFFQSIEDKFPGTTKFLQTPQNMAVAHDDLPNVAQHEDLISKVKDAFASGKNALVGGSLQEELAFLRYQQMNGETTPKSDSFRVGGIVADQMGAPNNSVEDRAKWIQGQLDEINKSKPNQDSGWIKRGLYGAAEFSPMVASGAMSGTKYAAMAGVPAAAAGAITGYGDIPITAAAATAGFGAGEADYNYHLMAGMAYDNLQKIRDVNGKPLPEDVMRIASIATGAAGALLSLVKLDALVGPAGKKFLEKFTSSVPAAVLENPATRAQALKVFTQNYVQAVAHGTAAMTGITAANIVGERGAEVASGQQFDHSKEPGIASQLVEGAKDAAGTFAFMGFPGAAVGLHGDMQAANKAKTASDFYKAFGDTAEASKLRARLPEAHQEFIKNLTKDGPVENVFIPHEAFQSYFQGKNVDPETVAGELGVQDSFKEAQATGGDVKIPLDVWGSKVAGTEHYQGLAGDIKFHPEDLTSNQVEERKAQIAEQMKATDESAKNANGEVAPSADESAQKVHDERYQQLIDAGLTPQEARLSAVLHQSAFKTLGERTGQDPYELAKRFQLEVQKRDAADSDRAGSKTFSQSSDDDGISRSASRKTFPGDEGNEKSVELESLVDSSGLSLQSLTDLFEGHAASMKEGGLGEKPSFFSMLPHVRSAILKDRKVLDSIVGSVPVDMVNDLFGSKRAAKKALHDEAMLKNGSAFNADVSVSKGADATNPVGLLLREATRKAAELSDITARSRGESPENISTSETSNGRSFSQDESPRAKITFGPEKSIIELFKDANRSSFLHESGHYFLEIMHSLSQDENAPKSIKDDMQAIRDWMGLKEGDAIGSEQHEKFARGFEQYLREGVAPSNALAQAFSKFKQWLVQIYRSAKSLDVELSPEIRSVMDRMLATDDEIKRAQEAIGFHQASGMDVPASVRPRMESLTNQAREQAESELMRDQMNELSAERKKFLETERTMQKMLAEKKVRDLPVYQAIDYIKSQVGERKNIEAMAKKFLDGKLKDEDAVHFETAAETQGVFADGKDLALNIINSKATDHFNKSVERQVEAGMAQHADLMNTAKIKERALELVHNEKRSELLELERNILADKVKSAETSAEVSRRNRIETRVAVKAAKDQAKQILDQKPVKDAGNFRIYVTAERNAAVKSDAAAKRGDFEKAAEYKRQQMLNHSLAAEAMRNKELAEKAVSYLNDAANRGNDLKKMPYGFNRQVDQLLEKFGFKDKEPEDAATLKQTALDMQAKGEAPTDIANATGMIMDPMSGQWRPETLRDFLSRVNDNYLGLQIPDSILTGQGVDEPGDLKMSDLKDLKDSVKLVTDAGQKYNRFLNDFIKVEMKEAANLFKQSVLDLIGSPYAENRKIGQKFDSEWKQKVDNLKNLPDAMIPTLVNTLTLCHYLDGGEQGPAHDYIYRPMKQAEDRKFARYAKMREDISGDNGLFGKFYTPKELADYKKEVTKFDGRSITKENILAMALNWGNESNRDRIRAGYGSRDGYGRLIPMSDADIHGLFKHLDKNDWDFAQATWDHLNTYWPEISALEMKMRGVEPQRVESAAFANEHGAYAGGYYPIAYEFEKSSEAFKNEQAKNELYKQYSASHAQTESGHAQARVSFVARPVRLSLDVLFNHLENVIHDLEFRPAIIDTAKFLAMPDVKKTLEDAIGMQAKMGLDTWLKSIASDQSENMTWVEKALTWTRFGTTIAQLGLTPKAFLLHMPSNVFNSMWEIGVKDTTSMMTRAALDVAMGRGNLKDFVFDKSERMKQRLTVRDRDIMDMAKAWQGEAKGIIPHFAFMSLHLADEAVSVPLWAEVYKKNLAELGERGAVELADETVTRTLGSGSKVDQINLQRGGGAKKLFTMFYSWESVMFNRAWLDGKMAGLEYRKENVGGAAAILAKTAFFAFALPAVHEALLREAMHNGPTTSDERKKRLAGTMIESPFAMLPFVRDIAGPAIRRATGEPNSDYHMSPVETALQNIYSPVSDGARIAFTDGKHFDEKYAEEVARGMAQTMGYPQQLNTWAFNFLDYMQNNGEASMKDFLSRRRKK